MAENKMKEVAKLLGVEMGVPFKIKDKNGVELRYNPFTFKDDGLYDKCNDDRCCNVLNCLLNGTCEIVQPILIEKEKAYLEGVLRPFKDRVVNIFKYVSPFDKEDEFISVKLKKYENTYHEDLEFPLFEKKYNVQRHGIKQRIYDGRIGVV